MRKSLSTFMEKSMLFFLISAIVFIYIPSGNAYADTETRTPKKMYNLMVFVRFDGEDEFIGNKESKYGLMRREMVENTYNKSDYSMKEYYKAVSNQKMELETIFLFADAENFSSFKLDHTRGYYSQVSDSNREGYEGNPLTNGRWREWCRDWGDKIQETLNSGVMPCRWDGSKAIDSLDDLDSDGDGKIDCITVIYSKDSATTNLGGGSEQASDQVLWAYQGNNRDISVDTGTKVLKSDRFEQTTIEFDPANFCYKDKNDVIFLSPTPSIHETGHVLGFNDLYSYYNVNDKPVYYGSIMAKQVSPIAQFMTAREREVMGWLDKSNIGTVKGNGDFSLKPVSSNYEPGLLTYKLKVPGTNNLYLYMEYRCTLDSSINKFHASPTTISTYGYAYGDGDANGKILRMKKNGLLVTAARYDDENHFPYNGNGAINGIWDLEVLGGTMGTKSDAPLAQNESITYRGVTVTVKSLDKEKAVFSISGMPDNQTDIEDGENEAGKKTYTLTYDANGGIVLPKDKIVAYEEAFGSLPVPEHTGYIFDGWYTERLGGTKVTEDTIMGNVDTSIYAHWIPKSYTLTFDSDYGNIDAESKSIMYGDFYGTLPVLSRDNDTSIDGKTTVYKFDGWYTEKNGKGIKVTENTKMEAEDITVYANWIEETTNNTYTLTYDANGGVVQTDSKKLAYEEAFGSLPVPEYTGYIFDGWYTERLGGTKVTEDTVMGNADTSIYAHWTPKSYTLTFDSDYGNIDTESKSIKYGDFYGTLPVLSRDNDTSIDGKTTVYKFDGWYTEKNGRGIKVTEDTKMEAEDITVYANWIEETTNNVYILTYDANGGAVQIDSKEVAYEEAFGSLPVPEHTGYTFDGWYTERLEGTKVTEDTVMGAADVTIYARWTKNVEIDDSSNTDSSNSTGNNDNSTSDNNTNTNDNSTNDNNISDNDASDNSANDNNTGDNSTNDNEVNGNNANDDNNINDNNINDNNVNNNNVNSTEGGSSSETVPAGDTLPIIIYSIIASTGFIGAACTFRKAYKR